MNSAEREGKSPAKKREPKSPPPASPEDSAGHTQADTALRDSESRYRTVFESTRDPADLDWRNAKSLGLRLVISLVEQLQGTIELDPTAGTAFTIVVKEKE